MTSPTVDRRFGLVGSTAIKAPVTALAHSNITLSGQQTIDGVAVLATNLAGVPDRVLCVGQTDATENGIYDVSLNAWTRSADANGQYDLTCGSMVYVQRGTAYQKTSWRLTTNLPFTIGEDALTFEVGIGEDLLTAIANALAAVAALAAGAVVSEQHFTGAGPWVLAGPVLSVVGVHVGGVKRRMSDFSVVGNTVTNVSVPFISAVALVDIQYIP